MIESVFVGMVTHSRSRFNAEGVAMATALTAALQQQGFEAELLVSDRNDYDPMMTPLSRRVLAQSAIHQADLEHRWRRYLAAGGARGRRNAIIDCLARVAMAAKRLGGRQGQAAAVRLLNIDLSHLRLMEAAEASGAPWSLILEDDAGTSDPVGAARDVALLMTALAATDVWFASLSESLTHDELGVCGLLSEATDLSIPGAQMLRASRPITNTVCATLYRTSYLGLVRAAIRHRGLVPVAPIDWRVNEVIMDLYEQDVLGSQSCVWVRPAIFVQRSMHDEQHSGADSR